MKIRIKYNAPVSLTIIILSSLILFLNIHVNDFLISDWFTVDGKVTFNYSDYHSYIKFISHILGHTDIQHFMGNAIYIILLGPILEEKHKSVTLLWLIILTAVLSGFINALFIDTYMLGASGIVYLFIVLVSFTNIEKGEFPLSLIFVLGFYTYKEFTRYNSGDISVATHFIGAFVGLAYGVITVLAGIKPSGQRKRDSSEEVTVIR